MMKGLGHLKTHLFRSKRLERMSEKFKTIGWNQQYHTKIQ